jgi:predicted 2-oxoglutarate/Fe(II)-dependent dioxygenase YbiX
MVMLTPGDPVPRFLARPLSQPQFDFSQAAGHHTVVSFLPATFSGIIDRIAELCSHSGVFDGNFVNCFLVIPGSPEGLPEAPGVHVLQDADGGVAKRFGLDASQPRLVSFLLDPMLRVFRIVEVPDLALHLDEVVKVVAAQPRPTCRPGAPVLQIPRVFEPELCIELITLFKRSSQRDTGFMRGDDRTGKSQEIHDFGLKRRRDCVIEDQQLLTTVLDRVGRRLAPEIHKAFQFEVTRVERCIVACYDAAEGGHFRIHRDNTSKATAHRRFAVTINLNVDDYDGGDLAFPEFGTELWRPPTGGAAVFSCSLLHEVRPITRGTRYCFLPFLFDEEGEKIRLDNIKFVGIPPA